MLTANHLGLEIIRPTIVLNGLALGAYTEGVCKEGADFICRVKNGVHACVPCDYAQLPNFRGLQGELNRIAEKKGFPILDIDGRIGALTAASLGRAGKAVQTMIVPPPELRPIIAEAASSPESAEVHRQIAALVVEFAVYFKSVADQLGAQRDYPDAPPAPESRPSGGSPPVKVPTREPDGGIVLEPEVRHGSVAPALAVVAGLAGLGFAVWGYTRYRAKRR